jgi:hypothetical protein
MKKLIALARERGLNATLLDEEDWPEPAPPDAPLGEALARDPTAALVEARRRGLEPHLVQALWSLFENRPVELGLFAWDVLSGSLLPAKETEALARFRAAARAVREVLPAPGETFSSTKNVAAGDLVRRVALPAFQKLSSDEMERAAQFCALGSIEANQIMSREHGRPLVKELLAGAHKFARFLGLAHLPTLATFYLDYLVRRCEVETALADFVEALADAGTSIDIDRETILQKGGAEELELANYMIGRAWIRRGIQESFNDGVRKGPGKLDYKSRPPSEIAKTHAASHLVVAHSFLEEDELPVPIEVVNEIVKLNPGWRYAARVRLALLAHLAPASSDLPLQAFDQFLAAFGNDLGTWKDLDSYAPSDARWRQALYARGVREATTLTHDRAAWESLGINLMPDEQEEWEKSVKARVAEQCRL